jgi:hypothetical protein
MLESSCYICISEQPVSEWYDLSEDPWTDHEMWSANRVWLLLDWLGADWLFDQLCELIEDDVCNATASLGIDLDDVLKKAISRMIAAHNPWDVGVETCDKCGREFQSLPREDHPEGILWCAECAAKFR